MGDQRVTGAGVPPVRLGWHLARARRDAGLRERELAEMLGVAPRLVRQWESGAKVPTDAQIHALADHYGVPAAALVPARSAASYEPASGRLVVGTHITEVPLEAGGNDAVLRAFLAAVRDERQLPAGAEIELRQPDLEALAFALDLDDVALEARLVAIIGVSAAEARRIRARLVRRRVLAPLAGVGLAAGAVALALPDHPGRVGTTTVLPSAGTGTAPTTIATGPGSIVASATSRSTTTMAAPDTTVVAAPPAGSATTPATTAPPAAPPPTRPRPVSTTASIGDPAVITNPSASVSVDHIPPPVPTVAVDPAAPTTTTAAP
jgi:transcriptional regulator with XRE-family HTH domain